MQNKRHLTAGLLLLLIAIAQPVLAQDAEISASEPSEQAITDEAITTAATATAVDAVIQEAGLSAEAITDETVTAEDLDAKTPGAFNFFTKINRTIRRTLTLDPIKKAEYRIEAAHAELLRAQKIATENPDDEKSQKKVEKALDKFESNIEKVKRHASDIKEKSADQAGDFLQKMADFQIKQQKVLDKLEERLPADIFEKVESVRQSTIRNQSDVMTGVAQNAEQITERFNAAIQNQRGSDFREFKNIEVLERVAEFVPAEARVAIQQAQAAARTRFEEHIEAMPDELRNEAFGRYMKNITGDPVHQMRALDNIKSQANLPADFFNQIEAAKEQAVSRFEERFRRFESPAGQEQFLAALADGSVENLRVIQQLKESVPEAIKQQIQQKEQESIQRFKENFADDPDAQSRASKFQELAQKMRDNPDSATFAAIQQLEQTLPAEQRQFVENLKSEAQQGFVQRFREEDNMFLKRIQSFDPTAIAHFQEVRAEVGGPAQFFLNQAINQQIDFVQERLQQIDDPARFERIKMQFEQNPNIQRQIETRHANFGNQLQNQEQKIQGLKQEIETTFQNRVEQERQLRQESGLPDFTEQEINNLKERALLRPQLQTEQGLQDQFRRVEENKIRREQQGESGEQAPAGLFRDFENVNPEIKQKLEEQFRNQEQKARQQPPIEKPRFIPPPTQPRIQQQPEFKQPAQTGPEQRFDPRPLQPTERGEIRRDEVRQIPPTPNLETKKIPPQEMIIDADRLNQRAEAVQQNNLQRNANEQPEFRELQPPQPREQQPQEPFTQPSADFKPLSDTAIQPPL